jgi:hypothetical protein
MRGGTGVFGFTQKVEIKHGKFPINPAKKHDDRAKKKKIAKKCLFLRIADRSVTVTLVVAVMAQQET